MKILVFTCAVLAGCATADDAPKVSASQWKLCWNLCGKGDRLTAATPTDCLCKGGLKIKTEQAEPEPAEPAKPFDPWEWMGFK